MKLKIETKTVSEIEITLPAFIKSGNIHFYKVYSEEKCIGVTLADGMHSIHQAHSGLAFSGNGKEESTEAEFNAAYNKVAKHLKAIKDAK
jgi:hypothetical protein